MILFEFGLIFGFHILVGSRECHFALLEFIIIGDISCLAIVKVIFGIPFCHALHKFQRQRHKCISHRFDVLVKCDFHRVFEVVAPSLVRRRSGIIQTIVIHKFMDFGIELLFRFHKIELAP